ncbi:D-3-phosphoglycerate dehydrogenase [Oratosquilla oratoria]|uniref:D-3-phosphoglycerate dehydrogenase n=1 Tax=Oratosquilla oratoria TaxID=337810 RepID=UPI003F769F74
MSLAVRNVLVLDSVAPVCAEILTKANIKVVTKGKLPKEELLKEIKEYDGVVVRSATKITAEVMAAAPNLKIVGRAGTGVDNIDTVAATRRGILVMNTPGGNTLSAAEHTCAMICALSRSLPQACASLKAGKWDRKKYLGTELYGKTLAILGLGRIGREVAKRMQAFGMTVIGYDPVIPASTTKEWNIESLSLEQIWPRADYITVHTPLIPQTKNLINGDVFSKCKKNLFIVNVARGGIVDERALLKALDEGRCGGAALDVFEEEPPTNFTLCQHPKVICTPHLGANTVEAQTRVAEEIAQQIVDMVEGRPLVGAVNAPALTNALNEECKPWISLGQDLGYLAHQISRPADTPSLALDINLYGDIVTSMNTFLGSAVLVGLLRAMTQNGVNLVNAPLMAQEAGVSVSMACHDTPPPLPSPSAAALTSHALQIKLKRGTNSWSLMGSVVGGKPTLYALDGCVWETGLTLGRNMLFYRATSSSTPIANIASHLVGAKVAVTSLLSSAPDTDEVWHVARTNDTVKAPPSSIPDTQLVAQVAF